MYSKMIFYTIKPFHIIKYVWRISQLFHYLFVHFCTRITVIFLFIYDKFLHFGKTSPSLSFVFYNIHYFLVSYSLINYLELISKKLTDFNWGGQYINALVIFISLLTSELIFIR